MERDLDVESLENPFKIEQECLDHHPLITNRRSDSNINRCRIRGAIDIRSRNIHALGRYCTVVRFDIRSGKSQRLADLPARHDFADDRVGASKKCFSFFEISYEQTLPNQRATDPFTVHEQRRNLSRRESEIRGQRSKQIEVALRLVAKTKIVAYDDRGRPASTDEHILDEVDRVQGCNFGIERQNEHRIDSGFVKELPLLTVVRQKAGRMLGRKELARMRFQREYRAGAIAVRGLRYDFVKDLAVAQVNAIKAADSQHQSRECDLGFEDILDDPYHRPHKTRFGRTLRIPSVDSTSPKARSEPSSDFTWIHP